MTATADLFWHSNRAIVYMTVDQSISDVLDYSVIQRGSSPLAGLDAIGYS